MQMAPSSKSNRSEEGDHHCTLTAQIGRSPCSVGVLPRALLATSLEFQLARSVAVAVADVSVVDVSVADADAAAEGCATSQT